MGRLTAIVLGSAAGGAFPQWNCRCPVCALAWAGDSRVQPRTQTGIAVSAGDGCWTLINASPDLPSQIRATPALHPRGALRGSPVDGVVLTGAEIDQIAGLLSLRESSPFTLYATPASHGSWNRTTKFGGDVIAIFLNKDGTVKSSEPFITGFLDNNNYIGRPVDVEFMADGSMLLSDDWNGAIYRITYGKAARVAGR